MSDVFPVDHPGVYISEELDARGWLQRDLAYVLGVTDSQISAIVSGKRDISAALAKALSAAFDVSADLFLNLQNEYDKWVASDPDEAVANRGRVVQHYPVREMVKRGWIADSPGDVGKELARFFTVNALDDVPHLRHAARKTKQDETPAVQLAWLYRVRQLASEMIVAPFSAAKLRKAVEMLKTLLNAPEEIRHVPRILSEAGVRFVVVEGLPGGGIDGVCFWLDDGPVIGLSTRYDRIDNFWFVLRHEIEHILRGDGKTDPVIDTEQELDLNATDIPEQEQIANRAAANFCVPKDEMDSFYVRKNPYFSRRAVITFAKRMRIHPGLVVGQLHFRMQRWDYLRDLQVKAREHLARTALIDGWGDVAPVG